MAARPQTRIAGRRPRIRTYRETLAYTRTMARAALPRGGARNPGLPPAQRTVLEA
jgi:hypothetical protein